MSLRKLYFALLFLEHILVIKVMYICVITIVSQAGGSNTDFWKEFIAP